MMIPAAPSLSLPELPALALIPGAVEAEMSPELLRVFSYTAI